jgi:outer membrane protein
MKKLLTLFILMIPLCASAYDGFGYASQGYGCDSYNNCCGDSYNDCCSDGLQLDWCRGWEIEGRVAAFRPNSKRFRKIYANWGTEYQGEIGKRFSYSSMDFAAFVNAGWYTAKGRSIGLRDKTRVDLVPVTFGLKYLYPIYCNIDAYLGLGAAATWVKTKDHNRFVKHENSKTGWGGIVKGGFQYTFYESFVADIFADWIFCCRVRGGHHHGVKTNSADVGGLKLGGGLGFVF